MEHEVFEQLTEVPSVSVIKVLEEASKRQIPIYNISKDNLTETLPKLEVSQTIKNNITSAVNEGKVVTIPERNIEQGEWIGTGYVVLDTRNRFSRIHDKWRIIRGIHKYKSKISHTSKLSNDYSRYVSSNSNNRCSGINRWINTRIRIFRISITSVLEFN